MEDDKTVDAARGERVMETLCPECGIGVSVDPDGCCESCGCVAVGEGIETVLSALDAGRAETVRLRARVAELELAVELAEGELAVWVERHHGRRHRASEDS